MNSSSKEIQRLAEALKEWRSSHSAPSRLPEDLWSQAARLAAKNGVGPIARALKLDHAKLKRLAEKIGLPSRQAASKPVFVEIPRSNAGAPLTCLLETESSDGALLRAKLDGASALEVATILREFGRPSQCFS